MNAQDKQFARDLAEVRRTRGLLPCDTRMITSQELAIDTLASIDRRRAGLPEPGILSAYEQAVQYENERRVQLLIQLCFRTIRHIEEKRLTPIRLIEIHHGQFCGVADRYLKVGPEPEFDREDWTDPDDVEELSEADNAVILEAIHGLCERSIEASRDRTIKAETILRDHHRVFRDICTLSETDSSQWSSLTGVEL